MAPTKLRDILPTTTAAPRRGQVTAGSHSATIPGLLGSTTGHPYPGTRTEGETTMAVDPTDPDTFEVEETAEEIDFEAPEVDAAEQHTDITEDRDDPLTGTDRDSANEADLAEQARVVSLDEDDYR
ncbi:hypothetical protein SGFS_044440 [Streptomyces graminofaciens]|uniref:DUF5709 domain-containing protein n=2 Tax=Streptomyces graminofaciens TaxID=68212 RepID=A0ABN5VIZ7_9ACTN|nr:hypothetical protein SGFS_044440 [Streptomyces graminofaciens]